jgi:protein SCO1
MTRTILGAAGCTVAVLVAGIALGRWLDPTWRAARPSSKLAAPSVVPRFSAVDQDGATVTDAGLRGRPWIADLVYTRCQGACPLLTARMVGLQRALPGDGIRFISFSVDPEHDSPAVLKRYAASWRGDEARWRLLHTERAALAQAIAGLRMGSLEGGDDEGGRIVHSDRFALVDGGGRLRGLYDSNDARELDRLIADARSMK